MEVDVEQFAKSTKNFADIMTLIQTILDEPAVRELLETIEALRQKIVELAARVGLPLGEREIQELGKAGSAKIHPKDEEMPM